MRVCMNVGAACYFVTLWINKQSRAVKALADSVGRSILPKSVPTPAPETVSAVQRFPKKLLQQPNAQQAAPTYTTSRECGPNSKTGTLREAMALHVKAKPATRAASDGLAGEGKQVDALASGRAIHVKRTRRTTRLRS